MSSESQNLFGVKSKQQAPIPQIGGEDHGR